MANRGSGIEFFAGLVIGGLMGASLSMLLAPQSGEETRAQLRDKSLEFKDRAEEGVLEARHKAQKQVASLQNQVSTLQEKGKEKIEQGKQGATEIINKGKDSVSQAIQGDKDDTAASQNS